MGKGIEFDNFKDEVLYQSCFKVNDIDIISAIHIKMRLHRIISLLTIFFSLAVIFFYFRWLENTFPYNISLILCAILLLVTLFYIPYLKLKTYYRLKDYLLNLFKDPEKFEQNIIFYHDKFYSSILNFSFDYSQISAIYCYKRGYIIEVPTTDGFFIRKDSFVKGLATDFEVFMETRTNKEITYVPSFLFGHRFRDPLLVISLLFCLMAGNLSYVSFQKLYNNPVLDFTFIDLGVKDFRPLGVLVVPLDKDKQDFDPYNSVFAVDYLEISQGKLRFSYKVGQLRSKANKLLAQGIRSFRAISYNNGRSIFYIDPKYTIDSFIEKYKDQQKRKLKISGIVYFLLISSWIVYFTVLFKSKNKVLRNIL